MSQSEQFVQMANDAEQKTVIEVARDEKMRVLVSTGGTYMIQSRTGSGPWQTTVPAGKNSAVVDRWADYRTIAVGYAKAKAAKAGQAAANAPWAEMIEQIYVAPAELEPHPDAQAYGADDDDRAALDTSTGDVGILEPLTCIRSDEGQLHVIDGCGRLAKAMKAGLDRVPVQIVALRGGLDARRFAAHKNAMGRKRSSGSRVLTYLMAHEQAVLEAAEAAENRAETGRIGGVVGGRGRENRSVPNGTKDNTSINCIPFSAVQIAKRLSVHKRDVLAGIDLLRASRRGEMPQTDALKRKTWAESDERQLEATEKALHGVLMGRLPVTRWLPAATGRVATADRGKAETDYFSLTDRTFTTLGTVFDNWYAMTDSQRATCMGTWAKLIERCPEEILMSLAALAPTKKGARP